LQLELKQGQIAEDFLAKKDQSMFKKVQKGYMKQVNKEQYQMDYL